MRRQEFNSLVKASTADALDLLIANLGRRLAIVTWCAGLATACKWALPFAERDCSYTLAHAPANDHLARDSRHFLQVVLRSCGDLADGYLFGGSTSKAGDDLGQPVPFRVVIPVINGCGHGDTQRLTTRNNRYLGHWICMRCKQSR